MLTPEQIELRRSGIGSSDIAAIAELDPHRGPIDVWLDKMGCAEAADTTATWLGDRLEDAVAALYQERRGRDDGSYQPMLERGETAYHGEHPWALATPDRLRSDGAGIVEIKNVGGWMAHLWGDAPHGAPIDKVLQVQWQLLVCDVEHGEIAALLGGTDFRIYEVERDRELGAELLELARIFWEEYVLQRVPPPHDGDAARRLAKRRWPLAMGDMLPATPEAEQLRDRILRVKRHEKRVKDLRARLEARAMELCGNAPGIKDCFTWTAPRQMGPWKAAARAVWQAGAEQAWEQIEAALGDDEARWMMMAQRAGVGKQEAMTTGARDAGRRFLTKEGRRR